MKNFFPSRTVSCSVLFCCCSFNLKIKPYNKSFIDQACSVKMRVLASFLFCVFLNTDFVSVHKSAKKELGQYPAILTSRLVNNAYIYYRLDQTWHIDTFEYSIQNIHWSIKSVHFFKFWNTWDCLKHCVNHECFENISMKLFSLITCAKWRNNGRGIDFSVGVIIAFLDPFLGALDFLRTSAKMRSCFKFNN